MDNIAIIATDHIEGDTFKGKYLNKETIEVNASSFYGGTHKGIVNSKDDISITFEAIDFLPKIGREIKVNGLFYLIAQNPNNGALLVVTKVQS